MKKNNGKFDENKLKYNEYAELQRHRMVIVMQYEKYRYIGYYNPIFDYNDSHKKELINVMKEEIRKRIELDNKEIQNA